MFSKKNLKMIEEKDRDEKQRFSIRKLTVGAASVLIGVSFFAYGNQSAQASVVNKNASVVSETAQNDQAAAKDDTDKTVAVNSVDQGKTTAKNEDSAAAKTTTSVKNENGGVKSTPKKEDSQVVDSKPTKKVSIKNRNAIAPNNLAAEDSQTEQASDTDSFLSALRNANTSTINLTSDIDFSNVNLSNATFENVTNRGIARTITINGNDHKLTMGNRYIGLDDNTKLINTNWHITLKNLTLQTTSGYGPFRFGNKGNDTLTFDGVTTTDDSKQLVNNIKTNVNFEGTNALKGNLTNSTNTALVVANNITFINGTTSFSATNNTTATTNIDSKLSNIFAYGNVVVMGDAKVDFNSENTSNMAGIRFTNGVNGQTIDNATVGVLRLMPNAQVTMELGSGYSMGVDNASNIDLQDSSSLKVATSKMALGGRRGAYRYAPLVGLDNDTQKSTNTVRVGKDAILSIIRTGVESSDSPLIGMGPYGGAPGSNSTYRFEVNGGSLDLEDSAYSNYLPETYSLKYDNSKSNGWPALLTMWGTSSYNYINFNDAKLIKLQRKQGYLIKTEGAENGNDGQNHIVINSKDGNYNTPLTIIPAGQTTPVTWNIKYLSNTSQGGNYALAFRKTATWNTDGSEYMNGSINTAHGANEVELTPNASDPGSNSFSNGKVVADANGTTASNALNDFINHFSWWNTSGVKFGSELALKNQYTVSYKTVSVEQGKTAATDPSFIGADGKDTTKPAGTTFALDSDAPEWASVDSDGKVTVTPGTDVTVDEYDIPVTVTYSDSSTEKVTIKVNVGAKTKDAAEYTPSYAPVNVEPGQTATTTPKFTDADGKPVTTIPVGTKFETGSDSPTWASVNPTTGVVTVSPARDVTPGAYNIPVTVTYPDNSTDETTIPVIVTKADQTVTWGDNGAIVTTVDLSNVKAHETTANSQVVPVSDVKVIVEGYKLTNGKLETTPITLAPNTVSWNTAPSTNVGEATAGEDITGNEINVDLTNNTDAQAILGTKTGIITTNPFTIKAKGANARSLDTPVEIKLNSDLTGDQFNKLVNSHIPIDQIASTSWLTKPDKDGKGGVIKITFADKDANGNPTCLNIDIQASLLKMTTDADSYSPSYTPITVEPGKTATTSPTFTGITGVPAGTTFKTGTDTPTWASVDSTTGKVTVTPTTPGAYNIPVTVTYQDGTTDETNVPVIVTKAGQTVTWGDNGVVVTTVDPSMVRAHKTSDKSQVVPVSDVKVAVEGYKLTNNVLDITPTSINVDPSTVSWEKAPNTVVDAATVDENTISGNKVAIDLSNNADARAILGSKNGKLTTDSFDITSKGAGAKKVTTPVDVKFGTDLTEAQFGQLVDNNIPTDQIASTTWATKPDKDGNNGVIKITFKDNDSSNNPTYLNVNIPSSSIKMTTDADSYTPESKGISTTQGTVPDASSVITNKSTDDAANKLPEGTTISWTNPDKVQTDVNTPGEYEEDITVTYPDSSTDNVTIKVTVNAKPVVGQITVTEGQTPNAKDGISNLNNGGNISVPGYPSDAHWLNDVVPDTSTPGQTSGTAVVTYPDGSTENVTIQVNVSAKTTDADKYAPEGQNISTPQGTVPDASSAITNKSTDNVSNKLPEGTIINWTDPNKVQTDVNTPGEHEEDITVTYPDNSTDSVTIKVIAKAEPVTKPIKVTVGQTPDAKDGISNLNNGGNTSVPGYPSDAHWLNDVVPDTSTPGQTSGTAVVTYPDGSTENVTIPVNVVAKTTDADKYTPKSQDMDTNTGVVPDPKSGIKNKSDLPDNTKYTWKDGNPDVTTPGDKTATILVTYPDNSYDEVPVTIHVKAPVTTTDADQYTPSYSPITVKPGQTASTTPKFTGPDGKDATVPTRTTFASGTGTPTWVTVDPSNGTVTLKPGTDVTPGDYNIPVTVTYPDGSNDNASATVHISNSTTTTDADKYTPEGQIINVIKGQAPDPANGIKNKGDLPEGTSYAWKDGTPDTTTPGDKSAVVVVTYPDGSKDEARVTIHVTNPVMPTDADQNNPEAQYVQTTVGKVPDPSSGIANKDKLPNGTKYTWQTTPDTSTTGNRPAVILVTYPDGSQDQVPVNIVVKSNSTNEDKAKKLAEHKSTAADEINQAAKDKKAKIDHMKISDQEKSKLKDLVDQKAADAIEEISNAKSLDEVNTAITAGLKEIESVAPNSSDLPDRPKAKKNSKTRHGKGASANVNGQNGNAGFGANVNASALTASNKNNKGALPQTGENESNLGLVGLAIAGLGALLGLAISRKRKN